MTKLTLAIYCPNEQTKNRIMEENKEILSNYGIIWVVDFFHEKVRIELID